jgi:phospholipase C
MNYFAHDEAHAVHTLAENFTVCDRWFSSVPGPTWANRFFVHSGTSLGRVKMGAFDSVSGALLSLGYNQNTIYNQLDEKGIHWAIYAGDIPQAALCEQLWKRFENFHLLTTFYSHVARAEGDFAQYAFIEPRYFSPHQNDDHPPHDVTRAQELLASIYNAIRANEKLWLSTLLVVLYDEHGGFYDHVTPPEAVSPDGLDGEGFDFKKLGVRVPAILVSPWVDKGRVFGSSEGLQFDHTSLLKYLGEKDGWNLDPLTERVRAAESVASFIRTTGLPRLDTPATIIMPPQPARLPARRAANPPAVRLNENQAGLVAFMEHMGKTAPTTANILEMPTHAVPTATVTAPGDPQAAKAHFQDWLAQTERDSMP